VSFLCETTLTRRRRAATTWVDGRAVVGATTDSTFEGSVQPMSGKERQLLAEGLRSYDGRKVYAPLGTLRVDDQHEGVPADLVLIDDVAFTVVHLQDAHPLLPHDRAYLVRVQEAE
jgi:hypothetical protein